MKKIKMGYKTYSLHIVENPKLNKKSVDGYINFSKQRIAVKKSSINNQTQILLHELIHAIDDYYDCKLNEDKVDKISKGLVVLFSENKEFFVDLLEKIE